ncbi:MAG TPA: hypothetical protein VGM09_02470 [Bradyrhizobium sp.]
MAALQIGFSAALLRLPASIAETGHPTGHLVIPRTTQEDTMLKTISAALLAISVLAAPAMAATATVKTAPAPIAKTTQAPAIKSVKAKPDVLNANARMGRHHHRYHRYHRHHRFHRHFHKHFHKHMGAYKAHQFSKVSVKHVTHAAKRG